MDIGLELAGELLALGVAAGFLAGLLGIGGGMLLVPFLTFILGQRGVDASLAVKMAIATSGATILFTSLSSLLAHQRHGAVRWALVVRFAPGILLGGIAAGAGVLALVKGRWLALVFAACNIVISWRMLRGARTDAGRTLPGTPALVAAGVGIGFLSGLLGAGGAFLSVPFMTWCGVPMRQAVGTSAALGFPIAVASTLGYLVGGRNQPPALPGALGFLYLPAVAAIAAASVTLAPLGARAAHRMPVERLRRIFALLLMALAGYMAWKGLA